MSRSGALLSMCQKILSVRVCSIQYCTYCTGTRAGKLGVFQSLALGCFEIRASVNRVTTLLKIPYKKKMILQ